MTSNADRSDTPAGGDELTDENLQAVVAGKGRELNWDALRGSLFDNRNRDRKRND